MAVERHPASGGWKEGEWMQAKGIPRGAGGRGGGCSVVWSAMSLLKIVWHYLASMVCFPAR